LIEKDALLKIERRIEKASEIAIEAMMQNITTPSVMEVMSF
tara:strand:+ start:393 stop:515 length:123 start_codon:yes stop_codon:yes gene_type:complete